MNMIAWKAELHYRLEPSKPKAWGIFCVPVFLMNIIAWRTYLYLLSLLLINVSRKLCEEHKQIGILVVPSKARYSVCCKSLYYGLNQQSKITPLLAYKSYLASYDDFSRIRQVNEIILKLNLLSWVIFPSVSFEPLQNHHLTEPFGTFAHASLSLCLVYLHQHIFYIHCKCSHLY